MFYFYFFLLNFLNFSYPKKKSKKYKKNHKKPQKKFTENSIKNKIIIINNKIFLRYLELIRTVAKNNKNKYNFGYINGIEFNQFVSRYGISKIPSFFIFNGEDNSYFDILLNDHNLNNINSYLLDVDSGKIELKSSNGFSQIIKFVEVIIIIFF